MKVWFHHERKGWTHAWSERGGWQGERTAQIAFALELERLLGLTELDKAVDRIGVADDFYFIGDVKLLSKHWEDFE